MKKVFYISFSLMVVKEGTATATEICEIIAFGRDNKTSRRRE
jgi:hypothetical protein